MPVDFTPSDIPTKEPTEVTAGDTIPWRREDLSSDYPATAWTLAYYAWGKNVNPITINAAADGADYEIEIAATESIAWQPGDYTIKGYVTETASSKRYEIFHGTLTVNVNPAQLGSEVTDDRSWAKRCLDAIEAVLEMRAGRADRSYQIAGRPTEHYTPAELMDMRARFKQLVDAEQGKLSGKSNNRILTRFVPVS